VEKAISPSAYVEKPVLGGLRGDRQSKVAAKHFSLGEIEHVPTAYVDYRAALQVGPFAASSDVAYLLAAATRPRVRKGPQNRYMRIDNRGADLQPAIAIADSQASSCCPFAT
jgi:hypothetical protein